LIESPS
jgi:hypothetical protein